MHDREAWTTPISVELAVTSGALQLAHPASSLVNVSRSPAVASPWWGGSTGSTRCFPRSRTRREHCTGTATLAVTARDELGQTDSASVEIATTPVNDAPYFAEPWDELAALQMEEDGAPVDLPACDARDVDGGDDLALCVRLQPPTAGTLLDEAGAEVVLDEFEELPRAGAAKRLRFAPTEHFAGTVSIVCEVRDAAESATVSELQLVVKPVPDAPYVEASRSLAYAYDEASVAFDVAAVDDDGSERLEVVMRNLRANDTLHDGYGNSLPVTATANGYITRFDPTVHSTSDCAPAR